MSHPPLPRDLAQQALDAFRQYGSQQRAADALGIPRPTLQARLAKAALYGLAGTAPVLDGFEISSISTQLGPDGETQKEWIRTKPEAGGQFEVPAGHVVKGVSALVGADGRVVQQWLKTKEGPSTELTLDAIREALDGYRSTHAPSTAAPDTDCSLATIYPIADAHFGLYAWGKEAGEDYDLPIADKTNREAFGRLVASAPNSETAVILGCGDLIHADDYSNRTAKSGNVLDVDTRYSKVLQTAIRFMIYAVDSALQKHGRVIFRNLPGNHDETSAFAVTMAVWAWFQDDPRVDVDTSPSRFWWWEFGVNLEGATHGDMVKMKDLPMVMASTQREAWGRTKYRTIWTGHKHHRNVIEIGGVVVECLQSTAVPDAWHAASGYRSGRSLIAVTKHKERGEIARNTVVI